MLESIIEITYHVSSITYQASRINQVYTWIMANGQERFLMRSQMICCGKVQAYRLALFAADLGWSDVTILMSDKRTVALSDQLYRALGSISANIAEGYSRESQKDMARYYEYALGSARESRDWYYKARHILSDTVMAERVQLLTQIIRLLMTMVQHQRGRFIKEEPETYEVNDKTDL